MMLRVRRRIAWPILAAASAVTCFLLGAWASRPTVADRCAAECGKPNPSGAADLSRALCNEVCMASVKE
jgi:hypothetical protein